MIQFEIQYRTPKTGEMLTVVTEIKDADLLKSMQDVGWPVCGDLEVMSTMLDLAYPTVTVKEKP